MRMGWEGESEDPEEGGRHTKPPSRSAMLRALHSNSALEVPWSLHWKGRAVPATIKKSGLKQKKMKIRTQIMGTPWTPFKLLHGNTNVTQISELALNIHLLMCL